MSRVWPVNTLSSLLITFIGTFFNSSSMENEVRSRTFILDAVFKFYGTQNTHILIHMHSPMHTLSWLVAAILFKRFYLCKLHKLVCDVIGGHYNTQPASKPSGLGRESLLAGYSLRRREPMGCYVYPLNEVSAGSKAERMTWRRTSARIKSVVFAYNPTSFPGSLLFTRTSLPFSCTSIDFSFISKFDSFTLGKSQHLLCRYSFRSLILRWDFTISRKKRKNVCIRRSPLKPVESGLSIFRFVKVNNGHE